MNIPIAQYGLTLQIRRRSIGRLTFKRTVFPTYEPGKAGNGEPFAGEGFILETQNPVKFSLLRT
jgi:hypothetical protein